MQLCLAVEVAVHMEKARSRTDQALIDDFQTPLREHRKVATNVAREALKRKAVEVDARVRRVPLDS